MTLCLGLLRVRSPQLLTMGGCPSIRLPLHHQNLSRKSLLFVTIAITKTVYKGNVLDLKCRQILTLPENLLTSGNLAETPPIINSLNTSGDKTVEVVCSITKSRWQQSKADKLEKRKAKATGGAGSVAIEKQADYWRTGCETRYLPSQSP